MHPARETDGLADVIAAKLAASMGAIVVHGLGLAPVFGARFAETPRNSAWEPLTCQGGQSCACGTMGRFTRFSPREPSGTDAKAMSKLQIVGFLALLLAAATASDVLAASTGTPEKTAPQPTRS